MNSTIQLKTSEKSLKLNEVVGGIQTAGLNEKQKPHNEVVEEARPATGPLNIYQFYQLCLKAIFYYLSREKVNIVYQSCSSFNIVPTLQNAYKCVKK